MLLRFTSSLLLLSSVASAAVLGTNPPALPVTAERIAQLPAAEQPAWRAYLDRSQKLMAADKAFFDAELKAHNIEKATTPPEGRGGNLLRNRAAAWFGSDEARKVADNVLSFQTPAGGWSKNMNFVTHGRAPGERFAAANLAPVASKEGDLDKPVDATWHYVGTFDNDATITELRFLARVATANSDAAKSAPCRAAVLHGLEYIFESQFPNGGWPQVYPLEGGYHDAITYNDDAMTNILEFIRDVADGREEFSFLPADVKAKARAAEDRGIRCILVSQIKVDGHLTAWCQQHDALTFAPTSARNYEMPSISGGESASLAIYLMDRPNPSPEIVAAVHAACAWFKKTAIHDAAFRPVDGVRSFVKVPGAGPIWPRYAQIGTDIPLFGDRDKSIHDRVDEISKERRNGYQWYGTGPAKALEEYAKWSKDHPAE